MATIILTGGGSAGHCTPHLALLPYLKNDFDKIYYIGSETGIEKSIIEKEGIPYYSVPCAGLKRSFTLKNLKMPFTLISGIKKAKEIIEKLKPDVIFSKGGYVSLPTVIAGKKYKVPVIAHESDYSLGLANRISAKFCKKVLTAFPNTASTISNGEYVGAPIRNSLFKIKKEEAIKSFPFSGNKPILLVTGGSLGAKKINSVLRDALHDLTPNFDIIHITGKGNLDKNLKNKSYFQVEFSDCIEKAFACASICVTRAGSNSLFELLSLKKPCVVIPLPKSASRGDQIQNASYFQKLGLINTLPQENLTKESLTLAINSVFANRFNIERNFNKHPISDKSREISRILADYIKS